MNRKELEEVYLQLLRRRCIESFHFFVKEFWSIVDPASFLDAYHINILCEHLQAVQERKIRNLLINIPPGHSKSMIVNVMFPAWVWLRDPSERILAVSGVDTLATRDSVKCRRLIESLKYRSLRRFALTDDQDTKTRFDNTAKGFRYSLSVGSSSTGERGDIRLIDDPLKAADAHSKTIRNSIITWFDEEFSTRYNNPETYVTVIIMQRLHDGDLSGHVLKSGEFDHLCLPGVHDGIERKTKLGTYDKRKKGDLLWPERYPQEEINKLRKSLGSYGFSGQIMQTPVSEEGGIIKKHWIKRFRDKLEYQKKVISIDCTFKDTKDSDYVVLQYIGAAGSSRHVLDMARARMDFPTTLRVIEQWAKEKEYDAILIEDKANGPAVISSIKDRFNRVIAINPRDSKEARLHDVSPEFEAGNWGVPEGVAWFDLFESELCNFPLAENDDIVDAMTQAALYLKQFKKQFDVYNPSKIEIKGTLQERLVAEKRNRENESYFR